MSLTHIVDTTNLLAGTGFDADEGASLLMAFRGLQAESKKQGEAHQALAKELETTVAGPFEHWAQAHRVRLILVDFLHLTLTAASQNRIAGTHNGIVDGLLRSYELAQTDVSILRLIVLG